MTSFGSFSALVHRLSRLIEDHRRLTLVVGSGLTAGAVPGVSAMLGLTERFVSGENNDDLTAALATVKRSSRGSAEVYGRYRQTVNEWLPAPGFDLVVQAAVLSAYPRGINRQPWRAISWAEARDFENDIDSWTIPPGVAALAELLIMAPEAFGRRVFTPNFDPLLEIAIRRRQGRAVTLSLKTDGSFSSVIQDDAIHVVHLHGYWRLGDPDDGRTMLHDPQQLTKSRPTLQNELAEFMISTTACAIGYGGWDDIFMKTLTHVARMRNLEVMWGFHASDPDVLKTDSVPVLRRFAKASSLVTYSGVETDVVFPSLLERLRARRSELPGLSGDSESTQMRNPPALDVPSLDASPETASDLLGHLDRLLGWRWDQGSWGSSTEPRLVYWSVRLRRRSVIHAVQARVAAALSAHGARVVLCLDDLGVERATVRAEEFIDYIGRLFADVSGSVLPTVVSLGEHLSTVERLTDEPGNPGPVRLPETPWRVLQQYLGQASPSIVDVLTVAKIIDFSIDTERQDQLEIIRHALERRDGNKLLTPVTLWTHFNHVVNTSEAASVMTLGGRDEAPMWQMWRSIFGISVGHLFNPKLSNLHQDSGFVRWDNGSQLRDYLSRARELPSWDQSGRLIPWLYTNAVLLRTLLDKDNRPPTVAGQELASWQLTRDALVSHRRLTIDALTAVIADFFEPGTEVE